MRIGVIGLGAMGKEIALKLLLEGHEVTVWNRASGVADELAAKGARKAERPSDAAQGDLALTLLFDDEAIGQTLLRTGELAAFGAGCLHACLSTVGLRFARDLVRTHRELGRRYVAAPMLGRPDVVAAGKLTLLAGGAPADVDLLEAGTGGLGQIKRLGEDPVHAQVAKLAANAMIAGAIEAMAEAAGVLKAVGADRMRFMEVMASTLFAAPIYKSYGPMVAGAPPARPSSLGLPRKNNASFLAAAQESAVHAPLAEAVRMNLAQAADQGHGDADWSTALAAIAEGSS